MYTVTYTINTIHYEHNNNSMHDARAMASTASYCYNTEAIIVDNTTGELLALYRYGHSCPVDSLFG